MNFQIFPPNLSKYLRGIPIELSRSLYRNCFRSVGI